MTDQKAASGGLPWPVIIMVGTLFLVILAGFLLRPQSEEDKAWWLNLLGTTNHGVLMNPPLDVPPELLESTGGGSWSALGKSTWKLVVVNTGPCMRACEDLLYRARQVDTRLNRRAELLDRGLLNFGDAQLNMAELNENYPGFDLLMADEGEYRDWIAESNLETSDDPVMLLINPIDVMQMYYDERHEGNGVLEDLEHLMKLAH